MPIARFELPDGRIGRFEVPEGTSPEQAIQLISSSLPDLLPKEQPVAPTPPVAAAPAGPSKPWWAPFSETATGETELGKELGPKVLGGSLAQDIVAAGKSLPTYAKAAVQSIAGGNKPEDLTSKTGWENDAIAEARNLSKQNAKDPALQEEYILGITRQKVQELPQNAMFSVLSMGAGLAAAAPGFLAGGPFGAYAAGTAASGLAAYRMDTNGFLRDIREHLDEGSIKVTGKPLTDKQWLDYAKSYNSLVQEHGLWEAVPEAIGNAVGAKLGGMIFKEAGKGLMGTLKSFGASALEFGNELGTETITQTGQHNTEVDAGLSDQPKRSLTNPSDIAKSAKEVLPDVLLLTGSMTGGAHIAGKVYDNTKFGQNKQIADAIKEEVKGRNFSPEKIRKEAIARLDPNSYNQELIEPEETSYTGKKLAGVAPPEPPEEQAPPERKIVAPSESQDTQAMMDEVLGINRQEPSQVPIVSPELGKGVSHVLPPKVEVTHAYPMGENTEYQVLRTPTGYVANLFDKDAGKYVLGSARAYPIQTFGADAEIKANEFAQEQMHKAAKFNPITPTVAPETTKETPLLEASKSASPVQGQSLYDRIGNPMGPAQENAKNEILPIDEAVLLKKVIVKTVDDGLARGKTRQQIVDQLAALTKGGIKPSDFQRINDYMTERGVQEEPKPAPLLPKVEEPKKTFASNLSPEFQEAYEHHLKSAEAANKVKSMVRVGTATQAQAQPFIEKSDKARANMYDVLFKEKDNLSDSHKEIVGLAERAIKANQRGFAEGMLNNVIKDVKITPENLDFYNTRVEELEAQAKPKESKPIKETHNLETLLKDHPLDQKRLEKFGNFDEKTKESIAKTNEYLQKLTDAINAKGFNVFEQNKASIPKDVQDLSSAFTSLYAGATRILLNTQHVAGKQARKSKKSYGTQSQEIQEAQKKLHKSHIDQNKDFEKARDLLGEVKRKEPKAPVVRPELTKPPEPEEIVRANEDIEYAEKEARRTKELSRSLWTALRSKLTSSNVSNLGKGYELLKAGKGKPSTDISTLVANGALDDFLPYHMRHDSDMFEEQDSVEYIYQKLRAKNYITFAADVEIQQLMGSVEEAEALIHEYFKLKEINALIDQAADEQREAEINARAFEPEGETRAAPTGAPELTLQGETPEEVRVKEKEKEDRAKAEKEAEAKAKADEGVAEFTLTGSNRPADLAAAKGQESLFGESSEQKALAEVKKGLVRFASGMSGLSDLETGARARSGHLNYGVGVDVGLLSNNAIDSIANAVLNSSVPIFIDSGAFSNFRQNLKGNGPKPLDFNKILAKYDQITEAIQNQNEEERTDYPRPIIVMPDVVGDQAASLELIKQHKNWIIPELKFNVTQPMIPIQKGELTLSQVYDELVKTLGTDDFIVGVPSQAEAVSRSELTEFLRESQPKKIHFLGAASDKKLTPLLNIVATESPDTKVTADASKVRSAILDGVAQGKTREQAVMDALMEEEDPGVLLDKFGPQLTDESNVIDGTDLIREIGKEKQLELIADQSNNLTDKETAVLEEEYGAKSGTDEFLQRLHDDVSNFITKGANSVKNKIRGIINKIANSLLSVAVAFNMNYVSAPVNVVVPAYTTTVQEVIQEAPEEAAKDMSTQARRAYEVLYPSLKDELIKENKLFLVTDKPTAMQFIFNPDGTLLMKSKVLLAKGIGDFEKGNNNIDANKITPAGVRTLVKRFHTTSTEGYDFDTVFGTMGTDEKTGGKYFSTVYHSVYTHLPDAQKRLQALQEPGAANSRYSFGCINVDKSTFGKLVKEHGDQMDGATLFVVPDNDQNVMEFINGKATSATDITRRKVEPMTKQVTTPVRKAEKPRTEQMAAKEEEFQAPLSQRSFEMPLTPYQPTGETFPIDRKAAIQEYSKVKARRAYMMREVAKQGSNLTLQQELSNLNDLAKNLKDYIQDTKDEGRTAGDFDTYARILLNRYEKNPNDGISKDVYDVVNTAYKKYPFLLEGLKLSFLKTDILNPALGEFDPMQRIVKLYKTKDAMSKPETIRHELVHSMEQLMSDKAKLAVIDAWKKDFKETMKKSQNPEAKAYFEAVQAFFENPSMAAYDQAIAAIPVVPNSGNKEKDREAFNNWYQFVNPSEYWAVNAEKLMARKLGSGWDRFVLAMKRLYEGLKKVIGVSNQSDIYKAFNEVFAKKPTARDAGTLERLATGMGVRLKATQPPLFPNQQPAQPSAQQQPTNPQQTQMFGGLPPGKRNIFGAPATSKTWDLEPETQLGSLIDLLDYKVADKHVDTRKVQQAITKNAGAIDDVFDVYMKEELYHGRTANELKDFLNGDLSPLISELIKDGLTIDDLEQYLHNRHAEERNDAIAKINARFADVDNEPGSGIGTKASKDYFKNLDPIKAAKLAKAAAKVDKIIAETQKILVDRGLETQETIDTWNQAYKHYVPLMRDQEELDFMHHGAGLGKGFQVKGGASKRAYGSTKSVVDILANIAIQRESAIIRSEKARIGRALYGLVLQNPNPDFWFAVNPDAVKNKSRLYQELIDVGLSPAVAQNFVQEPKSPSIDPLTGQVRYQINVGLRGSDNVFPVRINGKDRYIFFNTKDPKAVRMAQALSNLDAQSLGGLLGTTALVTRWIASVNTQYNPVFGMINFARDVEGAMLNLTDTPLAGKQKEVFSHVFPSMFAIYGSERFTRKNKKLVSKYSALFDEFRRAGGTTGYREAFAKGSFSGKDKSIIEREWGRQTEGAAMKKARYVFDILSDYNEAMENAVRLAVFKTAIDSGLSVEKAASLGKNITVNFNRKGQGTPVLQALYAFFNASVRGTVLVGKTLNGPAGRKIIAGGLALGVAEALIMAMAGFDNDEPPDYVKDKNFIIPISGGKYIMFPMPQGFNVIPGLGRIVTEYVLGKNGLISGGKPASEAAKQVITLMLDAFNPLGGGSMLQMLSPTVLDPLAAATMNKDAFGRPIYKEDSALKQTPGFMRSRENASTPSQWISQFLNYVSSPAGTKYTKGSISPTADEIDYYAGQVGGGAAREAIKAAETVKSLFTSEPQPTHRIPVVGRFYGNTESPSAIQNKFYNNVTLMNKYANEVKGIEESGQDPTKFFKRYPAAVLYEEVNDYYNEVNKMNADKKEMLKAKVPLKEIRLLEQAKTQTMKEFNDQVKQVQRR